MRCSVLNCKSDSQRKIPGLSFHIFPYNPNIKKKWIAACGRNEWVPKKSSKICSRHFDADHILKKARYTYIHPGAVPVMMLRDDENCKKLSEPIPSTSAVIALTTITDSHLVSTDMLQCDTPSVPFDVMKNLNERVTSASTVIPLATITECCPAAADVMQCCTQSVPVTIRYIHIITPITPDGIKVTSGPSLKCQRKISLGPEFNPVITAIKSEADLIKQEVEDPQSDDTLSLAEDTNQLSDADQPSEVLIPLSNAQVPLSNTPDPLSDVKVEEVVVGMDEVEVTRQVELTTPVELSRSVELTSLVEENRPVEQTSLVEETRTVEETTTVEESTVPLPLHFWQDFAPKDCYKLIGIQANQINKLSERCVKQRKKLRSNSEILRRREKRISNLRAELEALRSFIGECGWEVSSSGGGKIDVRRIQIRSPNTVVGQKPPNRQLLIVKRDYKPPKSSVSAQHTSDMQTSTVGVKRTSDILQRSLLDTLHTSDKRRKSSVGVKCTLDIQEKSSVSIPGTSDVVQKSSVGVKRILNNPSIAVQPKLVVPQTSSVGFQRTSDVRQNALVIQIDGMHNAVPRPKLVRLDDNSVETG